MARRINQTQNRLLMNTNPSNTGVSSFDDLSDTPSTKQANMGVRVNSAGDGLEYININDSFIGASISGNVITLTRRAGGSVTITIPDGGMTGGGDCCCPPYENAYMRVRQRNISVSISSNFATLLQERIDTLEARVWENVRVRPNDGYGGFATIEAWMMSLFLRHSIPVPSWDGSNLNIGNTSLHDITNFDDIAYGGWQTYGCDVLENPAFEQGLNNHFRGTYTSNHNNVPQIFFTADQGNIPGLWTPSNIQIDRVLKRDVEFAQNDPNF